MNRRDFSKTVLSLSSLPFFSFTRKSVSIRLLRHATLLVKIGNATILVDPMLSPKDAMDPVPNAGNNTRIPMVDLPVTNDELMSIINEVDVVLLTHTHRDHWDAAAQEMISKEKWILCQPEDFKKIEGHGFNSIIPVKGAHIMKRVAFLRVGGQHGTGDIGQRMGPVSGYVLWHKKDKIYISGDTVWCPEVEAALKKFKPTIAILNCGGAQFLTGDAITMTAEDVVRIANMYPDMHTVAVHMDTINHCKVTRAVLTDYISKQQLKGRISIPLDGETVDGRR